MKRILTSAGLAALMVAGAMLIPGSASAAVSTPDLARAECRADRLDDAGEFKREYGTGSAAISRCVTRETKQARRECRADRRYESAEFKREYGTGKQALRRCVRDELR